MSDNQLAISEGKTTATISYLTIIGTILAWIMNNDKKNHFASFHIRQMIGLNILYFINQFIVYRYFGWIIGIIIGTVLLVLWIIGFVGAINGEYKKTPLLGDQFQEWFKNI